MVTVQFSTQQRGIAMLQRRLKWGGVAVQQTMEKIFVAPPVQQVALVSQVACY